MTSLSWDDSICNEYVREPDGCILGNPSTGYKMTERAHQELQKVRMPLQCFAPTTHMRRQRRDAYIAVRKPQFKLDPQIAKLASDRDSLEPPLLHYGLVVDRNALEECAHRRHLVPGHAEIADDTMRGYLLGETVKEICGRR